MTMPDRTDELVRAMLERRASQPMPDWLFDRTMHAIVKAPRARQSRWPWQVPSTGGRLALVAAVALLLTLLAAGALLAAGVLRLPPAPPRFPAAVVAAPSPSASGSAEPSLDAASASPVPTPAVTPRPVPPALAADSLAVVTAAGDGLRVRSAPGTGSDSKKLTPLLPKGTRMLIVDGPVVADGYDWYEIQTDTFEGAIDLYGWVAAADKDGGAWIKPTAPACPAELDAMAIAMTSPMDLLACYGDAQFDVIVRAVFSPIDTEGESCPWSPGHGVARSSHRGWDSSSTCSSASSRRARARLVGCSPPRRWSRRRRRRPRSRLPRRMPPTCG